MRATLCEQVGLFDVTLMSAEDIDYTWRAAGLGASFGRRLDAVMFVRRPPTRRDAFKKRGYGRSHVWMYERYRSEGMPRRSFRSEVSPIRAAAVKALRKQGPWGGQWRGRPAPWSVIWKSRFGAGSSILDRPRPDLSADTRKVWDAERLHCACAPCDARLSFLIAGAGKHPLLSDGQMPDDLEELHSPAVVRSGQTAVGGFENIRWAWQQLDVDARYYFQSLAWMDRIATLVEEDVVWDVVMQAGQPAAVSFVRRSRRGRAGIRLRILSEVRVGDMGYPFTDSLLGATTPDVDLDDLLRVGGAWDVVNITSRRIGSPWVELAASMGWAKEEPEGGVGILDTRSGAEEWRRSLPKNMRDSVRKSRGRIAASGGTEVVVSTAAELPAAYERFVELEASGWKGAEGTALSQRPVWRDVLGDYLRTTDTAQVRSLVVGGRLVASQVCVTFGRTLVLMKVAYDEQLGRLSPGNVLMADLVEACCESPEIDRIDCLVWQDWHQRWGMVREPTYRIFAFNQHSLRGRAAAVAWRIRHRLAQKTAPEQPRNAPGRE
jgi:CelD/BcsL family acetyltransferase involved in cellulose biosynthesis